MEEYLMSLYALACEMAPYLLLGFLIAGLLHVFVPRVVYTRYLSGNDFRSVFLSAMFGVPLPLCSCGVIPTAMSMRKEGASKASVVSFIISTPQTGVDSIVATASLLGGPFAIIRPVVAFITALLGGMAVGLVDKEGEAAVPQESETETKKPMTFVEKCREAVRYGFGDMIGDIGKNLVIGLVLAGVISVFLPDDFFGMFADKPLLNMLMVLVVSIPMYLCATGSIPIAAALMLKGLSPGAALVLLMAGPATNMASIMVVGKVLGRKTLVVYMASIIVGAMAFGCLIDLLPAEWFAINGSHAAMCCHGEELPPLWKAICTGILLLLLVLAFVKRMWRHDSVVTNNTEMVGIVLKVSGMTCSHCKANVERAILSNDHVESVTIDMQSSTACVKGDVDVQAVVESVIAAGYGCKVVK